MRQTVAMVDYRRNRVSGGTCFFTVALGDRSSRLLVEAIALLREAHARVRALYPFVIVASAAMPDRLHEIWRLSEGDDNNPGRWRAIKAMFVRNLKRDGRTITTSAKGEADIWQRRYCEHTIRNDADLRTHIEYVHWNPVNTGRFRVYAIGLTRRSIVTFGAASSRSIGVAQWLRRGDGSTNKPVFVSPFVFPDSAALHPGPTRSA